MITSTKPIAPARSMTEKGTGRPRAFSTRLQKMWPPSSGRNGKEVDQAEREADHREEEQGLLGAHVDGLVADVADPDDAADFLAFLN